ncbi:hypothetical protein HDU80_008550 [Chytriomyces hyalinus]|nr:hypothetical protein HDU80_008550 [Chytriomyces hyalinus]
MEFHDSHSGSFTLRWLRSKILEYHTFSTSLLWTCAYPSPFKKTSFTTDTTTLTRSLETQFMHRIWTEPADYFEEVYFVERDADHEAAVVELVEIPVAAVTQRFQTKDLYSGSQAVSVMSAAVAIVAAFL